MGRLAGEAIIRRIADPHAEMERTVLRASYGAAIVPTADALRTARSIDT